LLAPFGRLVCYGVSELSMGLRRSPIKVVWKALCWPRFAPLALINHNRNHNRAVAGVNIGTVVLTLGS